MLVGGNLPSIAKAVFANDELRKLLLVKFLDMVNQECNELCRRNPADASHFRCVPVEKLTDFKWEDPINDLRSKAPTIFQIFSTIVSHNDHRNASKKGAMHNPSICMAAATLLKERNREMCGVQSVISIALYMSRVQKKVSTCMKM